MTLPDYFEGVTLAGGTVIYVINEIRKEIKERRKKSVKNSSLNKNLAVDAKIYPILWQILLRYRAVRVYVTQFHNGDNYYTGQSIQRETVSHEVVMDKGVTKVRQYHDNVLISFMSHEILMDMKRDDYFGCVSPGKRSNGRDFDHSFGRLLTDWMETYEVKSLFYFNIKDQHGNIVAVLNLHWNFIEPINRAEFLEIQEQKKLLETIFNEL